MLQRTGADAVRLTTHMEYRAGGGSAYSALMFAARITLPHFSVSSAISLPNSAGEVGNTVPPRAGKALLQLGISEAGIDLLVELADDLAWRVLGYEKFPPGRAQPEGGSKNSGNNLMNQRVEARLGNLRRAARCGVPTWLDFVSSVSRRAFSGPSARAKARLCSFKIRDSRANDSSTSSPSTERLTSAVVCYYKPSLIGWAFTASSVSPKPDGRSEAGPSVVGRSIIC